MEVGLMAAIIVVIELPPKDSCKILVSLEFLKHMKRSPSLSCRMTKLRVESDLRKQRKKMIFCICYGLNAFVTLTD